MRLSGDDSVELLRVECPACGMVHRFDANTPRVRCTCGAMIRGSGKSDEPTPKRYVLKCTDKPAAKWGPEKWRQLHTEVRTQQQWIAWRDSVPCGDCRQGAIDYEEQNPFREHDDWWGFGLHNHVNAKLDNPSFTEAEAQALYGWSDRA